MVRYVKNEGRPALGFAVESEESDESSDYEPLSDQPSLATLVSENPGSPPDSQAPLGSTGPRGAASWPLPQLSLLRRRGGASRPELPRGRAAAAGPCLFLGGRPFWAWK